MDITAFIRELLFGHDCVIVPGFGGFIGNYCPARIDKVTGTFYPPVKQISFNRNLNHNDGLLVKKVSGTTGLNYGDARNLVGEFVSDIRRKLERGDKVVFDKIGTFVNNHEGSIQFEPDGSVNYHLDSYGLEPFHCLPLEGYDVRRKILEGNKHSTTRIPYRKYLWRAAVIIPLALAMIAVPLKTDLLKSRVEATSMNPLVSAELEHNKAAVDQQVSITDEKELQQETVNEEVAAQPAPEEPVVTENHDPSATIATKAIAQVSSYYIITGSFQSEENASKQAKLLQQEGYNPEVIIGGNGFYRVCAMACPDLATAVAKKDSIIRKFPGSWISRKK